MDEFDNPILLFAAVIGAMAAILFTAHLVAHLWHRFRNR